MTSPNPETKSALARRRILLVEDDADIAEALQDLISEAGYAVERAKDGRQAIDLIRDDGPPELILLDMRMPRMNGSEFLRVISEDARYRNVPVVIISASEPGRRDRRLARKILRKPMNCEDVLRTLDDVCKKTVH